MACSPPGLAVNPHGQPETGLTDLGSKDRALGQASKLANLSVSIPRVSGTAVVVEGRHVEYRMESQTEARRRVRVEVETSQTGLGNRSEGH